LLDVESEAQELSISPRGTQIKTVHTGAMFTCSIVSYDPPPDWTSAPTIRWLGPGLVPVTATRGRSDAYFMFITLTPWLSLLSYMYSQIKHPVPDRVKPSFEFLTSGHSVSVRALGCQKSQVMA